ncbi:uncharacterized protein HD556DRAFT_88056 [Suillus plorans]|uniref:Uncharacterized protein n=1 Tax=Suillus plorans TaxID=116603 RepID=A0A9P7AC06_9AGAM|nr:uncharacterized protein HD556DRAFT_88056 [Suillus plorans]KAG1785848.1 hypothetical protein HD556DRAFT_88056 [Suillus plorans]
MSRKHDWDRALLDAIKSIRIQPSLTGYISKGIALCGKGRVLDARAAFDVASMYTDQDSEITHFLLLTKAIALFNADQHDEANLLLKELAAGCPNADTLACGIVQAYLHVELGIKALDSARYDEAADHFTAALDSSDLSSESDIHEIYEDLVVLFGWDLKSLWRKAHHKRCDALLRAGKLQDAVKSYQHMMASSDKITKADCLDWSNDFKQQCSALCAANGEAAFAASDYDKAIDLYSMAIDLDSASDIFFASRSQAKLSKMLWEDALLDARKVTELNPSSHVGYQLSHSALRGAQRYEEAIEVFTIMLSKLSNAPEAQIRGCDGNICTGPDLLSSRDERRSREAAMGIKTCHHDAGRHRVLVVWYLRRSPACNLWREEAKCARTAPAGGRGEIGRHHLPGLGRTIVRVQ